MVETHRNGGEQSYWGYLIKPDKSAAPHLEQLCLGLARIICKLEPGPPERLTPRRLATFYRSIGGNLDALFLQTSKAGLSFLYRTIGCFQSLEPSENPFETPSIPCLTPEGFVKWQTVQLLLCPEEHVQYLQDAVRVYNVPRMDGGIFPKSIPKESFPDKPDAEMETWHKQVTSQLNQESYMRARIKNSPYHSPHPTDRADGYFSPQIPRIRRPSRPGRHDSKDEEPYEMSSRRSSEPDWPSPANQGDRLGNPYAYYRDGMKKPSPGNRPGVAPRQRSATTNDSVRPMRPSNPTSRNSEHPPSSFHRGQYPDRFHHGGTRSPSGSSMGETSADDASSEDSRGQRRSKRSKATSTLLSVLPFTTPWHKRSRSHDVSYRKEKPSPREDDYSAPPMRASTETFQRNNAPSVRFRDNIFDSPAANSAPESPALSRRSHSGNRPDLRHARSPGGAGLTDPVSSVNYNLTREMSSGSGSENRSTYEIPSRQFKKGGPGPRIPTVTGVQGRKYANVEATREGSMPTVLPNGAVQQDPRNPMRYSLAV